jgi:hypothetical protein
LVVHTRSVAATLGTLLLSLAISGCIADEEAAQQADAPQGLAEAEFGDDTGAIEGLVLDGEQIPVPGAQVAIQALELGMATNDDGRFAFSHVAPGTHTLFVQSLGYESFGQSIEVVAGEKTTLEVHLEAIAIKEPYSTEIIQDGLFGCGASWSPPIAGITGIAACGVFSLFLNFTAYDKFLLDWEIKSDIDGWNGSVYEMSWESNQATGRGLTMLWEVCSNDRETRFAAEEGVSPLRVYASADVVHGVIHNGSHNEDACDAASDACNEDACAFISRVFSTPQTTGMAADIGVTFQQRFTQYHTAFFYEPGPKDYTAIMDG